MAYHRLSREQLQANLDALTTQEEYILIEMGDLQDKIDAITDQLRSQRSGSRTWRTSATSARDHTKRELDALKVELTAVRQSLQEANEMLENGVLENGETETTPTAELRLIRLMVNLIPPASDHHIRVCELARIYLSQRGVAHDEHLSTNRQSPELDSARPVGLPKRLRAGKGDRGVAAAAAERDD